MSSLCILGCSPTIRSKVVHRFPNPDRYPVQYRAWLKLIPNFWDKENFDYRKYRVCDRHFEDVDRYSWNGRINRFAIPKLYLPEHIDVRITAIQMDHDYHIRTPNNVNTDQPQPVLSDADVAAVTENISRAETEQTRSQNRIECIRKTAQTIEHIDELLNNTKITNTIDETTSNASDPPHSDVDVIRSTIEVEHAYYIPTLNNVNTNQPQTVISDADVGAATENISRAETEQTRSQNRVECIRKNEQTIEHIDELLHNTKITNTIDETTSLASDPPHYKIQNNGSPTSTTATLPQSECEVYNANSKRYKIIYAPVPNNSTTSTIPNLCIKETNSDMLCITNVTDQVPLLLSDAKEFSLTENISSTKPIQNIKLLPKIQNIAPYKPSLTPAHSATLPKSKCEVYNANSKRYKIIYAPVPNNSTTSTIPNLCIKETNSDKLCITNVTDQVPLVLSDAKEFSLTENISSTKPIQNTKLLPKIQNIAPYKPSLTPAHSATLPKSKCEVYNANSKRYKIIYAPVPNNSTTSTIPNLCIKETNSDKLCITNVTDQVPLLLSDAKEFSLTENISSTKPIQNTKLLPKIQNIAPYKPSLTPAHSATLLKSKCEVYNANSKRYKIIYAPVPNNSTTSTIPNLCIKETNSDKLCITNVTDQVPLVLSDAKEFSLTENISSTKPIQNTKLLPKIQNIAPYKPSLTPAHSATLLKSKYETFNADSKRHASISMQNNSKEISHSDKVCISDDDSWTATDQPPTFSCADARDTENTSSAEINSETLIPVRMYNEQNSIPGSTKRAKLDISELSDYTIVGSTTIITGMHVPEDQQLPLEDPLAIHISGLDINDCVPYLEGSVYSEENSNGATEDRMSYDEDNTSVDDVSSHLGYSIKSNDSNAHLEYYELDASVLNNEDDFKDSMSYDEDNTSVDDASSHLGDSIKSYNRDSIANLEDYELDVSVLNNEDDVECRVEIAYALKFIFHQGKTAIDAVKDIIDTYGHGKMSLKEAECWYKEFKLGNDDIIRIISSGGPVYK